jgi:hypothetical protein
MVDVVTTKNRIIEVIKKKGPSLPIQIAKDIEISSLFTSAFLSELVGNKQVKMSSLKVGGSPLYLIEGQEEQLEKFYNYLHSKEAEAFLMLKDKKVLRDSELEPAIRVALRAIRDFAFDFRANDEIYWRYLTVSKNEALELVHSVYLKQTISQVPFSGHTNPVVEIKIEENLAKSQKSEESPLKIPSNNDKKTDYSKSSEEKTIVKEEIKTKEDKPKIWEIKNPEVKKSKVKTEVLNEFNNPLVQKPVEKIKREKPKSDFVLDVLKFLETNNYKVIEEKDHKAKEYLAIIQVNFELGPINFYTLVKDKKSVSDSDLKKLLTDAQAIPLPAFFIYTGELSKKAKEYESNYFSVLKTKKMR